MKYTFAVLIWFSIVFTSCKNASINEVNTNLDSLKTSKSVLYAKGFSIEKIDKNSVIKVFDPWQKGKILKSYYLYHQGDSIPARFKNYSAVKIPLEKIAVTSLDNVGFLNLLASLKKVVAVSDYQRIYNPEIKKGIDLKHIKNIGPAVDVNFESLISSQAEAVFSTTYNTYDHKTDLFEKASITLIYNMDWMENTALGRAEWLKFVAAFLDKDAMADSIFKHIDIRYNVLKHKAIVSKNKPSVLVGSNYKEVWYLPGGKSYIASLLKDAGADYFWKNDKNLGSLSLSFEKVIEVASNSKIWIDVSFLSFKELISADERYSVFTACSNTLIYNNLGMSKGLANDYWETGLCRPDIILEDLVEIFHPNILNHKLVYYKKLEF